MLAFLGIIAILAVAIYFYMKKTFTYWSKRNVHQADFWTCMNDLRIIFLSKLTFIDFWQQVHARSKNDRYIGFYQGTAPVILVRDPELIKTMTVKDFDHFSNHRDFAAPDADPIWARNLFALKGERWRAMRATLSPSFTGSKMRAMFTLIDDAAKKYVAFYKTGPPQFSMEVKDSFTRLANDVIATCAFGVQVNSLKDPNNEFYLAGKEATNFGGTVNVIKFLLTMTSPIFKKIFKPPFFNERVRKFFSTLILSTIKTREEQNIIRPDMVHLLMEARKGILAHEDDPKEDTLKNTFSMLQPTQIDRNEKLRLTELTDSDIVAQAMIFLTGGFDTVATTLSFAAYELALNMHVQDRLRAEVKDYMTENDGQLTYNAILSMPYLDMVLSETLRKWPPGFLLDRVCSKTYKIPRTADDYNERELTLNPGDVILFNAIGIHRDPEIYPDPERFNPERFNNENKHNITPYNYMPFGVGPRHCIAIRFALMEVKTILAHLIVNFELYPTEKTHIPMKIARSITLLVEGGTWLGLKRLS